jgi:hypothetical protein
MLSDPTHQETSSSPHLCKQLHQGLALPALLHVALEVKVVGANLVATDMREGVQHEHKVMRAHKHACMLKVEGTDPMARQQTGERHSGRTYRVKIGKYHVLCRVVK